MELSMSHKEAKSVAWGLFDIYKVRQNEMLYSASKSRPSTLHACMCVQH